MNNECIMCGGLGCRECGYGRPKLLRFLQASIACALICVSAGAETVTCTSIGAYRNCSNGYSESLIGDYTFGSDGSSKLKLFDYEYIQPSTIKQVPHDPIVPVFETKDVEPETEEREKPLYWDWN